MSFSKLILLNLLRHRIRALIGSAGIAFGVAAMLAVLSIVLGAIGMFQKILSTDSQFLVFERNVSDLFFSSVPTASVEAIARMETVASAYPILFGIVSTEGNPVITCFGVEAGDPRIAKAKWIAGRSEGFGHADNHVYLGSRAAEFLGASLGDTVGIGKERYEVGGVLAMENGFEDGGVFMPLTMAQAFFHRDGYSSIVAVKLKDENEGDRFKEQIATGFPELLALENEEFGQSYTQFKILSATAWAVGICAFLLGGMGVANTMLMSVFGRIREIAVLRVTGFSKKQVASMIVAESIALAGIGGFAGFAIGYGALAALGRVPQLNGYVQPTFDLAVALGIAGVALITSVAGAMYPAWHATRIQPAEALRYE